MPLTIDRKKIEDLKHAPNLPLVVDELLSFLEEEKKKRANFLDNLHEDVKAEFIEGEIILNFPAKRKHYLIVGWLSKLLRTYVDINELGEVSTEKVLIHLTRNNFEPDLVFFNSEQVAGFDKNTMVHPAPMFAVEILSESTQKRDRGIKFEDYANHSVKEYWIIDPDLEEVEQYLLDEKNKYKLRVKSNNGEISLVAIPKLVLPIRAFFSKQENILALKNLIK
ncbi:MAG: Uma2 family endonuclease [Ferruginibacter sp.]|nr:Uma2 family endonuclease [Ferruginibacter sp.]